MTKHTGKQKIELTAQPREVLGHAVRLLRTDGILPAVLYGKGQDALTLQVPMKEFEGVLKAAGESTLVYVTVGKDVYPTIIKDVARDPLSGTPLHADFYKVRLDEKIKAMVPVVFTGEAPAVKSLQAIFVRNVNELEVEALPADLPHEIEVDISKLAAFGDTIKVSDIKVASGVLTADADDLVCVVQEPISQEALDAELAAPTTDVTAVEEIKPERPEGEAEPEAGAEPAPVAAEEKKE